MPACIHALPVYMYSTITEECHDDSSLAVGRGSLASLQCPFIEEGARSHGPAHSSADNYAYTDGTTHDGNDHWGHQWSASHLFYPEPDPVVSCQGETF